MSHWKPQGQTALAPMIIVAGADKVIDFAERAFDAKRLKEPLLRSDGRIWSAAIEVAGATILLSDGGEEMSQTAFLHLYVEDADAAYAQALEAGASPMMPMEDQFYGERAGGVLDPCGNIWWVATLQEKLSPDALDAAARQVEAAQG